MRKATMVGLGVLSLLACGDAPSAPSEFPQVAGYYITFTDRGGPWEEWADTEECGRHHYTGNLTRIPAPPITFRRGG